MISKKIFPIAVAALVLSCAEPSEFPGYDMTETGLYYQIGGSDASARAVQLEDVVTLKMSYTTDTDSLLFDSEVQGQDVVIKVGPPAYNGGFLEGLVMMKEGDTGSFITSADSFFTKVANTTLPEGILTGSKLIFNIEVLAVQSEDEFIGAREAEQAKQLEMEKSSILAYIESMGITEEPKESGLYFIETQAGSGETVARGDMVKVHYTGKLLTGEVFDSSLDRGEPLEFSLGTGRVIPGWDEGIGYMTIGSKAQLIIPSNLAYGPNPPPGSIIKPNSTLVFDVELIDVN